jgi:hypothetical protein
LKKLAFLGGAFGLGVGALLVAHSTQAADHLDSPGAIANPMADITDVYAWNNADATKVNLVMDVSPGDPGTRHFGSDTQYVFHVSSTPGVTDTTRTETKVICTFASDTSVQCWVGDKDYVTGDPSGADGVSSTDGKVKVWAGRRADPFFFNLNGFKDTVATVEMAAGGGLMFDMAGCPMIDAATGSALRNTLQEGPRGSGAANHAPCDGSSTNCFDKLDVMAIVLQVDKTLLNEGTNKVLAVWGSTHAALQ